jgi:hypothetical protein
MLIPVTAARRKNKNLCLRTFISAKKYFHAKGAMMIVAVIQR